MAEKTASHSGKRKRSKARAVVRERKGGVRINSTPLSVYSTEFARMRVSEALAVARPHVPVDGLSINVNVRGGGVMGQADAVACAIARSLVEYSGKDELLDAYHDYDRTLIAGDSRRTEPHKPSQSSKGPRHKRQKSYR